MDGFAPVGKHETLLANSIAEESWRLTQIRPYCSNLTAAGTFEGAGKKFHAEEGWNHQIEDAVVDTTIVRDHSKELALIHRALPLPQPGKKERTPIQSSDPCASVCICGHDAPAPREQAIAGFGGME
jgi:hypothetical protein